MLVLTRKEGEAVDITDRRTGQHIATVVILGVKSGGNVRIGFEGEPHIKFLRDDAKEPANVQRAEA